MADGTAIEWTDATANVINGCTVHSPGCANCYAMRAGGRNLPGHPSTGLTKPSKAGHVWTGDVRFNERELLKVLGYKRPRRIFWNAHGDLFHDAVPDEWIDRCFAVMALTPQHQHQVLTKRSARMRAYFAHVAAVSLHLQRIVDIAVLTAKRDVASQWPLPNVWLGVSVEDQQRADERIPDLLATPAAIRWLSCEPLLGPVDLTTLTPKTDSRKSAWEGITWSMPSDLHGSGRIYSVRFSGLEDGLLDWVVAGGESGTGARPMHPDWARGLRDQCAAAGVPFHFKQWGEWFPYGSIDADGNQNSRTRGEKAGLWHAWDTGGGFSVRIGKRQAGRLLDGVQHDGFPA